ncbi:hypothetical protein DFP72DRAFT_537269 [Ephemerocybe angulata]|uniref:G domain-containing protein n=1 Tax=Ephemerocybe angulata TaxID=980116 RepID=A0A8H6HMR4_9AGAR|nr:hypothetical protein DFP72DRAFT_537269 [Tulosesus angulatus]
MGETRRIIIPVMGMTKAGKSSFINKAASLPKEKQAELEVGANLAPCTKKLQDIETEGLLSEYPSLMRHRLVFVDTPGFDDDEFSDYELLQFIADHLKESYRNGDLLGGVLYLHDISRDGFTGTPKKNLKLFDRLCGENSMFKVVLVTTKWGRQTAEDDYGKREKELEDVHWASLIASGAITMRLTKPDNASAIEVVNEVLRRYVEPESRGRRLQDQILQIQRELVAEKKYLRQTEAAKALREELEKLQDIEAKLQRAESEGGAKIEDLKARDDKAGQLERQIAEFKLNIAQRAGSILKRWFR